ncbi:terpene synthase family protein [Chryseobacterium sp. 7]|uniref:terpene synthase family protein n=1 Tax=Chryseobacterium sp. 7 TaxID=2035214 RepID=UPI000EB2017C|nr:terpene synthase family protein [Chryseobacterium sp. 7]RLJ32309.1 terpene synthase family protein [Chryseobacterium sp. 7]
MKTTSNEEFYAGLQQLPKPRYPFPHFFHPDMQEQREEYYHWIDKEYAFHSKEAREKHKLHNLTDIAARGCPFLKSLAELRPLANYTANGAMMDDYFDRCSRDEMYQIMHRIIDLLSGANPEEPSENGVFHLFWVLRQDAIQCGIPENIYKRFVKSIQDVLIGYSEEKTYYRANIVPPLPVYLLIREATSGVQPYCDYAVLQKEYRQLPDEIFEHPHIRRIYTLCSLIIGIHNDIISLPKEIHRDGDTMNLVKVLQKENGSSLSEAYMKALEIHDQYLKEFLVLQDHLPPFGNWQSEVYSYVQDLGIMIAGVYAWHTHDTSRYVNGGYVEGEF